MRYTNTKIGNKISKLSMIFLKIFEYTSLGAHPSISSDETMISPDEDSSFIFISSHSESISSYDMLLSSIHIVSMTYCETTSEYLSPYIPEKQGSLHISESISTHESWDLHSIRAQYTMMRNSEIS